MADAPDKSKDHGRLNLQIDPELKRRFRIACADKGVAMTQVLIQAIETFVADYEKRAKGKHH